MSKWQKISLALAGLLLLSCLALAGMGAWWFTSAGGSNILAAMTGRNPATAPALSSTPTPQVPLLTVNPKAGKVKGLLAAGEFGIVSAVDGSSITVSAPNGVSRALTISNQARVIVVGVPNAILADVKPGDKVLVLGIKKSGNSLEPRLVIAAPADYTRANVKIGMLKSVSGQSLQIQTRQGSVVVDVDGNTLVLSQTLQTAQVSDLIAGSYAMVIGLPETGGDMKAQLIVGRTGPAAVGRQRSGPNSPTPTLGP